MEWIAVVVGLAALDVLALRWGKDSTDGLDSSEWEKRRGWRGFRHP